ncbi:MAG: tetratricopeptide repeat protein [Spirochaetes bacterium]|nr:tetratricopeptide repeat protein [Spirochaetota bacterium]
MLQTEIQKIKNLIKLTDYSKALHIIEKLKSQNYWNLELEELRAILYLKTEEYNKAYEAYSELISKNDKNDIYIKGLIESCILGGRYEDALNIINKYEEVTNKPEYLYYIGLIHLKNNNFNDALNYYLEYLKYFPENEKIYNDIGIIYKNLENPKEAINYFLKGIRLDPNYFLTNYNLAIVYFQIGEYEKAEYYFRKALKINKNFTEIYNYLGMIDIHKKRYDKALKNLKKAFEKDPDNLNVKNNLAILYDYTNNVSKAEELYKELIAKNSDNFIYYINLANILNRENKFDESLSYLFQGIKRFKNNPRIYSKIAETYYLSGNKQEALKYFNESLKIQSDNVESLKGIGTILYENKEYNNSLKYFLESLKYKNDDINILFNIASIYYSLKDYDKAILYLNKIIEIDPDNVDALIKLGQLYFDLKSYNQGFKILNKVKQIEPDNIYPYLILGDYYKNNNMLKEAIDEYSRVLNIKSLRSGSNLNIFNNTLEEYENLIRKLNRDKFEKLLQIQNKFKKEFSKKDNLLGKEPILSDEITKIEKSFDFDNIGTFIDEIENLDLKETEVLEENKEEIKEEAEPANLFDLGGVLNRKKMSEDDIENENLIREEEKGKSKEREEDLENNKNEPFYLYGFQGFDKEKLTDDQYDKTVLDKLNELKKDVKDIKDSKENIFDKDKYKTYDKLEVPSSFEEKYKIEEAYEEEPLIKPTKKILKNREPLKHENISEEIEELPIKKGTNLVDNEKEKGIKGINDTIKNIPPINIQVSGNAGLPGSQPIITQPQYISPSYPPYYESIKTKNEPYINQQSSKDHTKIVDKIEFETFEASKDEIQKEKVKDNNLNKYNYQIPEYTQFYSPPVYPNIPQFIHPKQFEKVQNINDRDQVSGNKNYEDTMPYKPEVSSDLEEKGGKPLSSQPKNKENLEEKDKKLFNDKNQEDMTDKDYNEDYINPNEVIIVSDDEKIDELLESNWNDKNERINLITNSLKILGKYFNESLTSLPPDRKLEIIADEKYKKLLKFIQE